MSIPRQIPDITTSTVRSLRHWLDGRLKYLTSNGAGFVMRFASIIIPFQFRLTEGQMVTLKEKLYENSREMQLNNVFIIEDVVSLHVLTGINPRAPYPCELEFAR